MCVIVFSVADIMVLAWEANLTQGQRDLLKTVFKTVNINRPSPSISKMLDLISRSKAKNTLSSYHSVLRKWKSFGEEKDFDIYSSTSFHVSDFISTLALSGESLATFQKLAPALSFFFQANRTKGEYPINDPFVKLLLEGAKREAASRKPTTKKAPCLSQEEMHQIIDKTLWKNGPGVIGPDPDLVVWRTVVKLYTYYKTFCRWNCYDQLTSRDL